MNAGADGDGAGDGAVRLRGAITTVHRYPLPLGRDEVWAQISQVSNYRGWWPWLRAFEASALAEGEEWCCEVQPPVPYPVRFRVTIEHIEAAVLVRARVLGDVVGVALLTLEDADAGGEADADAGGEADADARGEADAEDEAETDVDGEVRAGCIATLRSSLAPGNKALQLVSRFAGPVARFGHDWVLDSGARQFIARAVAPVAGD